MKATLIRFGIRNFKVKLRKASDRLVALRGPEDEARLRSAFRTVRMRSDDKS
jgi:hypothetical protein